MLCEKCNKNKANVHIVKVVNGVKQEKNLCDKCAKDQDNLSLTIDGSLESTFNFQNLISGLMDYINGGLSNENNISIECPKCKTTYLDFRKTGLLGCNNCYKTFEDYITPMIRGVQKDVEHVGKLPEKGGRELLEKRKILKLKEELQQAILAEEYEKAAEIRDEIKNIQKGE
ncbi:UvrB/UvrC motif-containing protein [Clostridium hydrogeniformans]|uniref:UvrB/UvrC motif-containing protein n=1 Tax=Clostridium hydrogeniformans TaxID=349933 RepID=UPI000489A6A8|nr:UvrB/UvrC motif-containing protein [Clostridium hydrogeniformans]